MPNQSADAKDELVVLVYGHGGNVLMMLPLQYYLAAHGFRVLIWRYPSLRGSVHKHARNLCQKLQEFDNDAAIRAIHLVGHCMGAIVVRCALGFARPTKLSRVVLLAPPNRGSRVATWLHPFFAHKIHVIRELSELPNSLVNQLQPTIDAEVGIIAAAVDHLVRRANTHLIGEKDHIVLRGTHTLPLHPSTPGQVLHFLKHGHFVHRGIP